MWDEWERVPGYRGASRTFGDGTEASGRDRGPRDQVDTEVQVRNGERGRKSGSRSRTGLLGCMETVTELCGLRTKVVNVVTTTRVSEGRWKIYTSLFWVQWTKDSEKKNKLRRVSGGRMRESKSSSS